MHRKHLTELIIGIVVVLALAVAFWAAHTRSSAGSTGEPGGAGYVGARARLG